MIPFNKPYLSGKEFDYISDSLALGKISGNGTYTKKCHSFFESNYGFSKCLLTTSCTDALEMAAILLDIQPGDEVILPSFTFVSTANAFVLRGATLVFADSRPDHPGMDESKLEQLITSRTKAIVVVHYAGVATDMDPVMQLAEAHGIFVVEDAAQAIDSYYLDQSSARRPLGGIGHLAAFSFHETKNIISGEGGMLVINEEQFAKRAEIIWEKGTNRSAFFRGEVDKYGWVDIGSSFLPSDMNAAFLYAQLESLEDIQKKRLDVWKTFDRELKDWAGNLGIGMPFIPIYATNNAHMFYLVLQNLEERNRLISHLKEEHILAVFHYQSLHESAFFKDQYQGKELVNTKVYTDCLVRLPLFAGITEQETNKIIHQLLKFH